MQVFINGIEYDVEWEFSISEQTSNKTSSDISVDVGNNPFPVSGDVIEVYDGDTRIFWGTCGIPKSPAYSTGYERKIYEITCGNANSILANRIINLALQNATVTEIVQTIFTDYISQEGITLGTISNIDVSLEVYTAANFNLQDALNELADLVGAVWQVTASREFYFVVSEDFPKFPHTIDADFLFGSELQHSMTDYTTRTVQYISGATDVTQSQTESFSYDGENATFTTVFPLAKRPEIYVNGTQVPPAQIAASGLETDDTLFVFSYNSQEVSCVADDYLTTGDVVKIVYIGIFPIRVSASNLSKIGEIAQKTGTSGKIEKVQLANNISNFSDAFQLAQSLLSQFSEARGEISWWMTTEQLSQLGMSLSDVALLTQLTFYMPQFGIEGDYVITERTITPYYGDLSTDFMEKLKVSLKLVNRDFVKSYGEIISDLRRDINQLSIRADDTVISTGEILETLAFSEQYEVDFNNGYYPVTAGPALFAPLPLGQVYPV